MATDAPASRACCKIGRVTRRYGLDSLAAELVERWQAAGEHGASLRELQRELNRAILRETLLAHDLTPLEGEVENLRRLLRDSPVSESQRIEARRRLEKQGIDVDDLLQDFVSHQSVFTHLRECRDASAPDRPDEERLERAESTVYGLRTRTETVTANTLAQLGAAGLLDPESFDVVVEVQAICDRCGRSHDVDALLTAGGCECRTRQTDSRTE